MTRPEIVEHDATMSQKEYLKKYMSFGNDDDKKKKKKKKHKVGTKTVKIIDDDIDLRNMRPIEEGEFDILLEGEDAPQIAGIVDERGPVDFSDKKRWKIITENEEGDLTISSHTVDTEKRSYSDAVNARRNKSENVDPKSKHSRDRHSDLSPPRQSRNYDSDLSLPGHSKNYDSDLSPPRQPNNYDSDMSPPRQSRNNNSDSSPPRQRRNNDSNRSPIRRSTKPRASGHGASGRNWRSSGNRDNDDSDFSPPRRPRQNLDADLYESRRHRKDNDSDLTVSFRSKEHRTRRDSSPRSHSRRDRGRDYFDKHLSKSSRESASSSGKDRRWREYEDRDYKYRSHSEAHKKRKKSRWNEEADFEGEHSRDRNNRMTRTLDGKTAGLQNARALREETEAHKRREAEQFNRLSRSVTGVGQAPTVRDKTGRKRNLEAEAAEEREKEMRQRQINEKYSRWGKGLKQVEDREEKLKSDLYEMSKPLARYADDEDLDRKLREREREDDPMLAYIREKQIKEGRRKPDPPQYEGSYAPNRFGIKPGRRWDGVDRSNGYEKKWYEAQNSKVALQEEAYKWSTADM